MRRLVQFLSVMILVYSLNVRAEDELSLDDPPPASGAATPAPLPDDSSLGDELNKAMDQSTAPPGTTELEAVPLPTDLPASDLPPPTSAAPPPASTEAPLTLDPTPNSNTTTLDIEDNTNQLQEDEYALNGYSFGALAYVSSYTVSDLEMSVNAGQKVDLSSKSADFQSVGVMGRYAILPINRVGTDIKFSVGSSINHANNNYSSINVAKLELNLGYSWMLGVIPFYVLGGVGTEVVVGKDIGDLMKAGGGTIQGGAGFGLGKKVSLEFLVSQSTHALNNKFAEMLVAASRAQGGVNPSINGSKAKITSFNISGQLVFNF